MPQVNRFALLAAACAASFASLALAAEHKPFKPKLDPPAASDFRTIDPENVLVVDTTKGRFYVEMAPEVAPQSVARVKELAREHFYDGLTFHRVVDQFMSQGGDPKGDGSGGSTKPNVPAEFTFKRGPQDNFVKTSGDDGLEDGYLGSMPIRSQNSGLMVMTADGKVQAWGLWCPGVAGMARAGDPNSANSQVYFMRQFNEGLEHKYTPWGRVVVGEDVVRALKTGEPVIDPDKFTSVRVLADLPNHPTVQVLKTDSAYFKAQVPNAEDACDIQLPGKVIQ